MKLQNHQFSTRPQIFEHYEHPWYKHTEKYEDRLIRPNPPTKEAVDKAKFVDKTYQWRRDSDSRPRKQRVTK